MSKLKINYKWTMSELWLNYKWTMNELWLNYKLGWKCSFTMAFTTSFPPLMINFIMNILKYAWISSMNFFHFFKSIWKMSNLLPCWFTNVIAFLMDKVLQLTIWYPRIKKFFHFILLFVTDFNRWKQLIDFSWDGGCMVGL